MPHTASSSHTHCLSHCFSFPRQVDSILREERPSVEQITDDNFPIILDNDKMCKTEDGEDEIHFILFVIRFGIRRDL